MAITLTHNLLRRVLPLSGDALSIPARTFTFKLNRTGAVHIRASVKGLRLVGRPGSQYLWEFEDRDFDTTLIDPDGRPFSGRYITMADLDRYRDAQGIVRQWSLRVGEKRYSGNPNLDEGERYLHAHCAIEVVEEVASASAGPLVSMMDDLGQEEQRTYPFDLYRLGTLRAHVQSFTGGGEGNPVLSLIEPGGAVLATSSSGFLSYRIDHAALARSRGPGGVKRLWQLRVQPNEEGGSRGRYRVSAQVYESARITASVLQGRLDALLGTQGTSLTFGMDYVSSRRTNQITMKIHDEDVADTLDLFDLVDLPEGEDVEVEKDYELGTKVLDGVESVFNIHWEAQARNLRTKSIRVNLGASYNPPPPAGWPPWIPLPADYSFPAGLPAARIEVNTEGRIHIDIQPGDDADVVMPNLRAQVAFVIEDGVPLTKAWIDFRSIETGGQEGDTWGFNLFVSVTQKTRDAIREELDKISIEKVLFFFLGARFTFTAVRWTGDRDHPDPERDAIEFEYIAGVEPERLPRAGYLPRGVQPPSQPNWSSPNLQQKVDHIVVLMMENRSFDHVLGHLSLPVPGRDRTQPPLPPRNQHVDGLTPRLLSDFGCRSFTTARFSPKTKFPLSVGHDYEDVWEQLGNIGRDGAWIPTMKGFDDNFRKRYKDWELQDANCDVSDVLGYYPHGMLTMYDFLASEFMVCDRFFCSHLGPTMPNRMFSLTGDYARNRFGEPRLHNDFADGSVQLAREVNLFDVLSRLGVSWRVYESAPSVAMLRFFARYAGSSIEGDEGELVSGIRDIKYLKRDLLRGQLPKVTFIDPAFHYAPNHDLPPTDMMKGQQFIWDVYEALKQRVEVFNRTLLIITYDEHGGFFDHVVPPTAEGLVDASGRKIDVHYGIRVPSFLVSPYVPRGENTDAGGGEPFHEVVDFTSILKTILVRFCSTERPFLSDRVTWATDFGPALSLAAPRTIPNPPPRPNATRTPGEQEERRFRRSQLAGGQVDWEVLTGAMGRAIRPRRRSTG